MIEAKPIANTASKPKRVSANSGTPESKVLAAVKRWADNKHDVYIVRVVEAGENGVADFLLCVKGRFVAVECKADGKKLRPLQELHGQHVETAGGVFLWGNIAAIIPALDKLYWED